MFSHVKIDMGKGIWYATTAAIDDEWTHRSEIGERESMCVYSVEPGPRHDAIK